ncbi:MAG: DUF1499 domain-containing protein [Xenococcaceae cyanobacterium]
MSIVSATNKKSKLLSFSTIATILFVIVAVVWIGFRIVVPDSPTFFAGTQPNNLGISSGQLAACPSTPNCVSSQSKDSEHYIEPLTYQGSSSEAIERLKQIISQDRSAIVEETNNYLKAEFTSRWMGFVDDVEFDFNEEDKGAIEVRSASRLGESDLGVNRQRIETIRSLFGK